MPRSRRGGFVASPELGYRAAASSTRKRMVRGDAAITGFARDRPECSETPGAFLTGVLPAEIPFRNTPIGLLNLPLPDLLHLV